MEYKLLSLDTSTSSTGWAVYVNGEYQESGYIKPDGDNKLISMVCKLFSLIGMKNPDVIAAEEMVVTRNAKTARNLTMVLGALLGKCLDNHIDWQTLRPTEWRKLIDPGKKPRKREELKEWSKQKVKDLFDIDNVSDDVSDAILIGMAYINMFNGGG